MIKINLLREKWKVIPNYSDYAVSNQGRIMRITKGKGIHCAGTHPGKILKSWKVKGGYLVVGLFQKGKQYHYKVSKLVAIAFLGLCPIGKQINHKNGIKTDDKSNNFEYITQTQNIHHAYSLNLISPAKGESHWNAKLRETDILRIFKLKNLGWSQRKIGNEFDISQSNISNILNRYRWKHITHL